MFFWRIAVFLLHCKLFIVRCFVCCNMGMQQMIRIKETK